MIAGHDFAIFDFLRIDIPQKDACAIAPLHPELLIEIAIINFSAPAHADRVAAHQTINGSSVKRLDQQLHVLIKFIVTPQIRSEPADGKIRERVEVVKHDSEMLLELSLVIGLKLGLRRR